MGRFTLRDEGKTIALGKVLKYKPAKVISSIMPSQVYVNPGLSNAATNEETKKDGGDS